jgi:hypothetical protein
MQVVRSSAVRDRRPDVIRMSRVLGDESVECVRSARGLWDGRGWVADPAAALQYPPGTGRAEAARGIVEEQTGLRCWVVALRPEAVAC